MTAESAAAPKVRVAIVDDHESVRLGVAAAIEAAGMQVVAAAETVRALEEVLDGSEIEVLVREDEVVSRRLVLRLDHGRCGHGCSPSRSPESRKCRVVLSTRA